MWKNHDFVYWSCDLSPFILAYVLQVADGTFMEEPGSGAVAIIGNKKVSVGTLEWVER